MQPSSTGFSPVMTDKTYPIMEVFGPTIQGEGAMAGKPTHFIRMGGCDYRCAWCDTSFAVIPAKVRQESIKLTTHEILEKVDALQSGPQWVTISGGNPALHDLTQLVDNLQLMKFKVAVETQGTLWKDWLLDVDQLTISPKPPSANMGPDEKRYNEFRDFMHTMADVRGQITNKKPEYMYGKSICIKIPVFDEVDYEYAIMVHMAWIGLPFYFSVVTRMGGLDGNFAGGAVDTRDDLLERYKWLAEKIASDPRASGTTAFPQLHALLWGHGRGF